MRAVLLIVISAVCLKSALAHSTSRHEATRHRFFDIYVPSLLKNRGWEDTEANRIRLKNEMRTNDKHRRHLAAGTVPKDAYMPPGCACSQHCFSGMCTVANKATCSFTQSFGDDYTSAFCKSTVQLADYQGTAGYKLSTRWMDCLTWNLLPCYSPEISVFYTKALQQGVYANAQDIKAFPEIGSAIPNNVDKNRKFTEAGTNTPEAQADVVPEGGKIRIPRQKVLTLDVRVTYVYAGDDYKAYLGKDADTSWCMNTKNGASWDADNGNCVCAGENECEVATNNDGVTKGNDCNSGHGSSWFTKAACKGHCSCKPKPTPDQTMASAKTKIAGYIQDMHKAYGNHLQFKMSSWRKLDISTKTGTPPTGSIREAILDKGLISLDYKALEWLMKAAKDINPDITKAPFRNPNIELLIIPKARKSTAGEAFGDHQNEYEPNNVPTGVATILLNYETLQNKEYRQTFYHEMGHVLGLFHTFEGMCN